MQPKDCLVCIDDSIVYGTTLKVILNILSRTQPRKIVVASTAPQIRYPDYYGIDMSELGKFIAFKAAVELVKSDGCGQLLQTSIRIAWTRQRCPPNKWSTTCAASMTATATNRWRLKSPSWSTRKTSPGRAN